MNARRASLLALPLIVLALLGQAPQPPARPAPVPPATPTVTVDGRLVEVPVTLGPSGPQVALAPLARLLGGTLAPGEADESWTLKIGETEVILGIGSAVVTVGDSIASLSQPPTRGDDGPRVPLDFLNRTFGDLAGYAFDWRPEQQRLTVGRRSAREINVALDVVYLQGMTTVVLQFDAVPRYRLREQPGQVTLEMLGDRLAVPAAPPRVENPLVADVQIAAQQVALTLAPGAEVESYVLENPFRLVFDVHQPTAVTTPSAPTYRPTELPPGIRTIVIDPGHGGTETGAVGPSGVLEKELHPAPRPDPGGAPAEPHAGAGAAHPLRGRQPAARQPHGDRQPEQGRPVRLDPPELVARRRRQRRRDLLPELARHRPARRPLGRGREPRRPRRRGRRRPSRAIPPRRDLQLILWDLAQTHHLSESQRLAALIQAELNEALQLKDRGVKQAPFRVLMGAAMPAVLVELGFLSNPEEEKKLQEPAYRAELAEALVRAIARYKEMVEAPPPSAAVPGAAAAPPAGRARRRRRLEPGRASPRRPMNHEPRRRS